MAVFHWADYLVLVLVIVFSLGIGVYYAFTSGNSLESYLLGNRKLRLIPTALSLMVSLTASGTLLGLTAEMNYGGSMFWLGCVGTVLGIIFAERFFVTVLYPLKLVSAYEIKLMKLSSRKEHLTRFNRANREFKLGMFFTT
ncbi:unnamed protein product [Owenia fusiformis]|uniref:Sodium-dependent multivitamin transporter n=1 Tax=Owenia fusiformis TaxID=6347 RepID=A0A8S4PH00_OWEFU|nr:unnamed protein product [Owenia fusiformis]